MWNVSCRNCKRISALRLTILVSCILLYVLVACQNTETSIVTDAPLAVNDPTPTFGPNAPKSARLAQRPSVDKLEFKADGVLPIPTTRFVLPDDSICKFGGETDYSSYICNDELADTVYFTGPTRGSHHLLYSRALSPKLEHSERVWPIRTTVAAFKLFGGDLCTPLLRNNWQVGALPLYQCVDGQGTTSEIMGDISAENTPGYWHIENLPIREILLAYDDMTHAANIKDFLSVDNRQSEVELELQRRGYLLRWQSDFESDGEKYRSQLIWGPTNTVGPAFGFLVVYKTNLNASRLIGTAFLNLNQGVVASYQLGGKGTIAGWYDLNEDGYPELALEQTSSGSMGNNHFGIYQVKDGQLKNLLADVEPSDNIQFDRIQDVNGDGFAEVVAFDRSYGFFGCGACGFWTELILTWNGLRYVDTSAQFPRFYEPRIEAIHELSGYMPHQLAEQLVLLARIGRTEEGWTFLDERWNHDAWHDFYGQQYAIFASKYGDQVP